MYGTFIAMAITVTPARDDKNKLNNEKESVKGMKRHSQFDSETCRRRNTKVGLAVICKLNGQACKCN